MHPHTPPTTIDVLVPSARKADLLRRCLRSLDSAAGRVREFAHIRILVLLNQASEEAAADLERQMRIPELQIWTRGELLPAAAARNVLLPYVTSEWLFFIDDDAFVDEEFFRYFLTHHARSGAAVIGGPNLTPGSSSKFQRASGAALASRLGAHASSARYAPRLSRSEVHSDAPLILCNLFFNREKLAGLKFPENLKCNEENWLMQDLLDRGGRFVYDPDLSVRHERRGSVTGLAAQVHGYGIGRGQTLRLRPATFNIFHLVPSLSLAATFLLLALGLALPTLFALWCGLALLYLFFVVTATVRMRVRMRETVDVCLLGALLFPLIHCSYGTGVVRGLVQRAD